MADHKHIIVSKRLVAINSASAVAAKIINFGVLLWVYQHLIKRIPADEFAVLPVVTAVMVFAPLFFSFFSSGISRYTIDAYAKGDFVGVRRIVSSLFPILLLAAAVFLCAGLIFAANIEKVFNVVPQMVDDARIMMGLLVASFAINMTIIPFRTGYDIRQRYLELNLLGIARDLLRNALLLVLLLTLGPAVIWVVISNVIAEMIFFAIILARALRMVPQLRLEWRLFDFAVARQLMSFGMWTTLGRLGAILYTNAATLVLNLYGSAIDVTSYYIGATFFRQMQSTIGLAALPLQPAITAMNALQDRKRLANTVMRGGRYALWASMLLATPLMIYSDVLIELYLGPDYAIAATVIVLFMMIFPFNQPTALLSNAAMAMAEVRAFFLPAFLFQAAGFALMVGFTVWLKMGAVGVTLSLAIITIASQLLYFWSLCLKLTGLGFATFRNEVLLRGLAPAAAGALVWGGIRLIHAPASWAGLTGLSAVGAVAYCAVLLGFCLTPGERRDLGGLLRKLRGRIR